MLAAPRASPEIKEACKRTSKDGGFVSNGWLTLSTRRGHNIQICWLKPLHWQLLFKFELSIVSRGHALGIYVDVSHEFVAHEREDGVSTRQALRAHSESTARAGRGAIECAIKKTLSAATIL